MKHKILTASFAAALIIIMSSFTFTYCQTNKNQDGFWIQLGITEKDAKSDIRLVSSAHLNPVTIISKK